VSSAWSAGVALQASGSTVTAILRQAKSPVVWVANLGDSRTVLVKPNGTIAFSTLDHNPKNPTESKRVQECGCELTTTDAEDGEVLHKIVAKGMRGSMPELGFTRSLGDLLYKKYGVIAVPEIFRLEKELGDMTGHFILATDGVWEFLENDEAANIAAGCDYEPSSTMEKLLKTSKQKWQEHEEDYYDDISAMMVPVEELDVPSPELDDSCMAGVIHASQECRGRIDQLCTVQ